MREVTKKPIRVREYTEAEVKIRDKRRTWLDIEETLAKYAACWSIITGKVTAHPNLIVIDDIEQDEPQPKELPMEPTNLSPSLEELAAAREAAAAEERAAAQRQREQVITGRAAAVGEYLASPRLYCDCCTEALHIGETIHIGFLKSVSHSGIYCSRPSCTRHFDLTYAYTLHENSLSRVAATEGGAAGPEPLAIPVERPAMPVEQ